MNNIIVIPPPPSWIFRRLETLRRKERSEAHLYLTVEVYQEDDFQSHQGADLVDFETAKPR